MCYETKSSLKNNHQEFNNNLKIHIPEQPNDIAIFCGNGGILVDMQGKD